MAQAVNKKQLWLHVPTFTVGEVYDNFIEFKWNGKTEESYFPVLKEEGQWIFIGNL